MTARTDIAAVTVTAVIALVSLRAADIKVDLSKEKVGAEPTTFLPMVGAWVVTQDGPDKAILVDGTAVEADLKSQPARSLAENARAIYGAEHEAFLDNAKRSPTTRSPTSRASTTSPAARSRRSSRPSAARRPCSGILFNGKANGDYLAIRYNDTDRDVRALDLPRRHPPLVKTRHAHGHPGRRLARAEESPSPARTSRATIDGKSRSSSTPWTGADFRQGRAVVEDRQHQQLQGLRGQSTSNAS